MTLGPSRYAGRMSFTLTVQQRAERCRCNRYLAWWTTVHSVCCGCMCSSQACECEPTDDPAEGCFRIEFSTVRDPEGKDPECE
jgi:hypothetical protein